nr:signal peptide peptidase SppA [Anaerolineae bacterium]
LESLPHLLTWREASRWLRRPVKWTTRQLIGVVSLEGLIVPGRSRRVPMPVPLPLPFVEAQAGAETIVRALRCAEANRRIAAVILHVETPGGSALASDLICREVRRLRKRKPVVVLMGGQATSGGYYVSTLANRIVARPTTLTGSIGIWGGKFVAAGLYRKLGTGREAVQRGAMAGLYSELAPFSDEERARVRRDLGEVYARFKARVAEGRGMTEEQVEEIARGRVWTGAQAFEVGLVDELGDFETALTLAKELAGLDPEREYTVVHVRPPRHELLPSPFPLAGGRAGDGGLWVLLDALRALARERVWALAPWVVQIRG